MNSTQSIFDLAIKKNKKKNKKKKKKTTTKKNKKKTKTNKSIQSHHLNILGYKSSNLSMKCYVLAFSHI